MTSINNDMRIAYATDAFLVEKNVRRGLSNDQEIARAVERRREEVRVTISDEGRRTSASSVEGGPTTREAQKVQQAQNAEKIRDEQRSTEKNAAQNRERQNAVSAYRQVANL